jgi:hypothetical protein
VPVNWVSQVESQFFLLDFTILQCMAGRREIARR